jgi:hypothetical protein
MWLWQKFPRALASHSMGFCTSSGISLTTGTHWKEDCLECGLQQVVQSTRLPFIA